MAAVASKGNNRHSSWRRVNYRYMLYPVGPWVSLSRLTPVARPCRRQSIYWWLRQRGVCLCLSWPCFPFVFATVLAVRGFTTVYILCYITLKYWRVRVSSGMCVCVCEGFVNTAQLVRSTNMLPVAPPEIVLR